MSLNKETLYSLINEIIDTEYNNNILYKYNNRTTGVIEDKSSTPPRKRDELVSEDLSIKEFDTMINKVIAILRNMEPEERRNWVGKIARPFGFMTFQQFLKVQNTMVDSADGKLDDPKK